MSQRVAFLQSKNLTAEEVEAALARAGEDPSSVHAALSSPSNASQYPGYPPSGTQQVMRPAPLTAGGGGYGAYQGPGAGPYWQPAAPPELPRRDWRDWFIMATVVSGVSYGLFAVAKVCDSHLHASQLQFLIDYSDTSTLSSHLPPHHSSNKTKPQSTHRLRRLLRSSTSSAPTPPLSRPRSRPGLRISTVPCKK